MRTLTCFIFTLGKVFLRLFLERFTGFNFGSWILKKEAGHMDS